MSLKMINIGRENANDIHYRYQRSSSEIRYSGKGKNTKTALVNLEKIGKQLYTIPGYIAKYFATRFATTCKKDSKRDEWYLKGQHTVADIEEVLEDFIDQYILCPRCRKPETSIRAKNGVLKTRCYVCGTPGKIYDEIIIKYVAKNPQDDSKMYRAYTRRKASQEARPDNPTIELVGDFDFTEKLPEDDEVDWGEDVSEAAVKARAEELTGAVRSLVQDDDSSSYEYYSYSSESININDI